MLSVLIPPLRSVKQMSAYSEKMASYDFDKRTGNMEGEEEVEKNQLIEFCRFIHEHFELAEKWEAVQQFVEDHPIASVFLIVTIGMCTVPIVVFIIFVMTSVALSIMSVFLFEGTIIAIGTFVLGGVLFFVALFAIGFSMFLISSYYAVQMSRNIFLKLLDKLPYIPFLSGDRTDLPEEKEE